MGQPSSPKVEVTIRIEKAEAGHFDEIVRALGQAGLAEVQPHPRFLIVNGAIGQAKLDALQRVPGVASVRVDQRYRPQGG